jgi:uncharacterized protein (TIGR03437 family)
MRLAKATILTALLCSLTGFANAQQNRINRAVNARERFTLAGHIHPLATAANDRGRVASSRQLSYVTLTFTHSPSQDADLQKLLADQQNPKSASYHRWLSPEEYADRFGVSAGDLDKITSWLRSEGLTVANVARGRGWVVVNGSAAQVEAAFQTELHEYLVNGETHFANASEPSVPAAIGPMVMGIRGLHDFRMRPLIVKPRYTSEFPCEGTCLAPADFATIYSVNALYAKGIDGTGQKIAVVGQTDIDLSDIQTFRSNYGLPANLPQVLLIPGSPDPGVSEGDLPEADLDLEWSGAVAKNATIIFVNSNNVENSIQYAIDADLAPVVSSSYGLCELDMPRSDATISQSLAQYGNTLGITWVNASGDAGAADCDEKRNPGLSVDSPADVPEVTGVGGTEFAEGAGTYWSTTNNPVTGGSALSYIPETSWNDPPYMGIPAASGGGMSIYFAKPPWQPSVPLADGGRNVPDVSLTASADHDGYLVQTGGSTQVYGGTSVSAQAFAGILALLNQYLVSSGQNQTPPGLGNANKQLYSLAQTTAGIFNDITSGNNVVTVQPCSGRVGGCTAVGYQAGAGYDLVTGLGSTNADNLADGWTGVPSSVLQLTTNLTSLAAKDTVFLIATATDSTTAAPTGTVTFTTGAGTNLGSAQLLGSNGIATATLPVTGSTIGLNPASQASQTIMATYKGSSATVTAHVTLNALAVSAGTAPLITGSTNAGSFQQVYAPGMIMSVFGSQLASSTTVTNSVPFPYTMGGVAATIDGEAAPLWYVSGIQWNIQIPYETAPGTRDLEINNNGQVTHESITVATAAPGVFTDPNTDHDIVNGLPAVAAGQETVLYLTGAGAVSPSIATGAAPLAGTALNALPSPTQTTTITVAGQPVTTPLEFNAIIPGLVGVVQVNFTIPPGVPAGRQPVVVTVGGVPSATVFLTVAAT